MVFCGSSSHFLEMGLEVWQVYKVGNGQRLEVSVCTLGDPGNGALKVFKGNKERSRQRLSLLKERPPDPEQNAAGTETAKATHPSDDSDESAEHAIGNWRKGHFVQKPRA